MAREKWGVLLRRDLTKAESELCGKVYGLAVAEQDFIIDRQTDELNATGLLELACDEFDIEDGSDEYSLIEDLATEIASIYERLGKLDAWAKNLIPA